ncbi:helix-turn-helix transcriptional regulator [Candidatus Pantoea formicae]|uniref:helix-turn-helix transcriptional regulator n=1 Tax=Candidatus Pantoea formicae TaxID=2608355 RepID=UPI003ED8CE95
MKEHKSSANNLIDSVIEDTKVWIQKNLDKNLTSCSVCSRTGYTRWYFQRSFRQKAGITLKNYIQKARVEGAMYDIMYSELPFTSIAWNHGFNSVHTFLRSVKKFHGMTPSEIRDASSPVTPKST